MSVGAVTARSSRQSVGSFMASINLRSGTPSPGPRIFTGFRGTTASLRPLGSGSAMKLTQQQFSQLMLTGSAGPVVKTAASRAALKRLALQLLGPLGRAEPLISQFGVRLFRRYVDPTGFPGWGEFPEGWTSNNGAPWPEIALGEYTANGFDVGPYSSSAKNLVDTDDGSAIFGFRYWGHFEDAEPETEDAHGDGWPTKFYALPETITGEKHSPKRQYRKLPDLSMHAQALPRWNVYQNISIAVKGGRRPRVVITNNFPRKRGDDMKTAPKNIFAYFVLKKFANIGGELKEWTDIFAEATGYIRGSMLLPDHLRNTGKETQAKLYWLFFISGINSVDWELLEELVRYNSVEDVVYGLLGRASKSASRGLGLTVGFQTGPL